MKPMTPISGRPNPIDDPEPTEQLTEQLADRLAGLLKSRRLATEPDPLADDLNSHLMLRQLAATLPPAAEVLADPALLAALSAATALADPPLYQTFLSHYILCAGSVALLGSPDADPGGDLAHARAKGSFLVTELGDASSHLGIRTTARFDPAAREFTLHTPDPRAAKFSSVAARGLPQKAAVCARLICAGQDAGVFSFLVDLTDERGRPVPGCRSPAPSRSTRCRCPTPPSASSSSGCRTGVGCGTAPS